MIAPNIPKDILNRSRKKQIQPKSLTTLLEVAGTSLTSLAHAPSGLTSSRSLARLHTDSETTYLL
jgi:hypothetical protein